MRLNSVDAGCARLVLAAGTIAGRISWRLGRPVRAVASAFHEALLLGGRGVGVPYVPAAWIEPSEDAGARVPAALYPSPTRIEEEAARCLAELRRGFWRPDRGAPLTLGESGWNAADEAGRSMQVRFQWNALHPAALLLAGHRARSGDQDLALALALAARWIRTCLFRERDETIWDDHITAMRALLLCDVWNALGRDPVDGGRDRGPLGVALARHAEKLSLDSFYRPGHNHGITQALALLATASALRAHPAAARWAPLARRRLEEQMSENVSEEGVHLEHSPYYHFFVLRQFLAAERLARAVGTPLAAGYRERLHKMLGAGASMIGPDGALAALGDTWHGAPVLITPAELEGVPLEASATLRFVLSGGSEGSPPSSAVYPGGGLAVLRGGPAAGESHSSERRVTMRLSVYPTSHIHHDALSITLDGYGSPLLIDPGGPYGYGDPLRHRYFTTTAAHNTVTVDSANQSPGPCVVRRWERRPGCDILEAEHSNYPGVLHRRTLFFLRRRFVLLVDRLESAAAHRYEQRFHFAPDLEVDRDGDGAVASRGEGGPSLRLVPLLRRGEAVALDHGGEDPAHGWACTGDLERRATWVASRSTGGSSALFATLLVPAPGAAPPVVTATELPSALPGEPRLEITLDALRIGLHLRADGTCELEAVDT